MVFVEAFQALEVKTKEGSTDMEETKQIPDKENISMLNATIVDIGDIDLLTVNSVNAMKR